MIFLILSLITFAALSLSSAQSDYHFSERLADRKASYYAASNTAEEILDRIDALLADSHADFGEDSLLHLEQVLSDASAFAKEKSVTLTLDTSSAAPLITYMVPVDHRQAIHVVLEPKLPQPDNNTYYSVRRWQVVFVEEWQNDNRLTLLPLS